MQHNSANAAAALVGVGGGRRRGDVGGRGEGGQREGGVKVDGGRG